MKKPLSYYIGYGYTYFTIIATAVMVIMKLNQSINISWWWVFSPLWGSFALALLFVVFFGLLIGWAFEDENT